jgi:hypothetical protein
METEAQKAHLKFSIILLMNPEVVYQASKFHKFNIALSNDFTLYLLRSQSLNFEAAKKYPQIPKFNIEY